MTTAVAGAPPVEMTAEQWKIVAEILDRAASGRPVWAYGSRAKRVGVKAFSDLDLIVGGVPLGGAEAWGLEEAFDESRLPFRVQFQHVDAIGGEFRERIAGDLVVLQGAGGEGVRV